MVDHHPSLKQTASVSKLSCIDVSQLDKINAIPNKITDNVLMDGLCQEDQLYLSALMDDDSSESEEDDHTNHPRRMSSAWSPMAQSPMMMMNGSKTKRMRRLRPSYAITLSLEDISYIRPSWALSKGVKRIEMKKKKRKQATIEQSNGDNTSESSGSKKKIREFGLDYDQDEDQEQQKTKKKSNILSAYHAFLMIVITLLLSLMLVSYLVNLNRQKRQIYENKIKFDPSSKTIEIFRNKNDKIFSDTNSPASSSKHRTIHINYGRGIPSNLKSEDCSCEMFQEEERKFNNIRGKTSYSNSTCFACLDWSMRANLQIWVTREREDDSLQNSRLPLDELHASGVTCYDIKWQSYDTLTTPLVDCFSLNNDNEHWFGLGDRHSPAWTLGRNYFNQSLLVSNLASEFTKNDQMTEQLTSPILLGGGQIVRGDESGNDYDFNSRPIPKKLHFGSFVNFTFFTSNGFFLGDLRSDFKPSIWFTAKQTSNNNNVGGQKNELCLSVSCTDKCTRSWTRKEQVNEWKHRNNLLEYRVCSGSNWRYMISKSLRQRTRDSAMEYANATKNKTIEPLAIDLASGSNSIVDSRDQLSTSPSFGQTSNVASISMQQQHDSLNEIVSAGPTRRQLSIAEGIGLVDRTIFATSPEFIPTLDGQTLRQFVDDIVKLSLKTSPILLVDTRWQTYVGSLKLNSALFPKAKLLFEILHNKGFKIVLTVKPYIDTQLGIGLVNSLTESNRLYKVARSSYKFQTLVTNQLNQLVEPTGGPSWKAQQLENNLLFLENSERNVVQEAIHVTRRLSFFNFKNETITIRDRRESRMPYLHPTRDSSGYCALVDITDERNRLWMVEMIKRSNWLTQEADGIQIGGSHPDPIEWDDHYREAMKKLIDHLFYKENLYTIPQWSGNFGYIQLAPRARNWHGLRTTFESVLNLGTLGFVLIHPGSVWGDFKQIVVADSHSGSATADSSGGDGSGPSDSLQDEQDLAHRWLQLAIFLPILQFKDLTLIEKFSLHEQVQNLVKIRKIHVVPEVRRHLPFTPLVGDSKSRQMQASAAINDQQPNVPYNQQLPVIRHVWQGLGDTGSDTIIEDQFFVGTDILVAPIFQAGQRQRDIFLPNGFWHDELRQTQIRGGKWLRNYLVEMNEIAWFTKARRR